jgi:hypothetical protein
LSVARCLSSGFDVTLNEENLVKLANQQGVTIDGTRDGLSYVCSFEKAYAAETNKENDIFRLWHYCLGHQGLNKLTIFVKS